ncbi:molybdopterin-dependent oxidoreductase, partial [Pseudomonas sp. TJI-51]
LHLQLRPGTNVAMLNALAHVIVTEGLLAQGFIDARCETEDFARWRDFVSRAENAPQVLGPVCGVAPEQIRAAARLYATGG